MKSYKSSFYQSHSKLQQQNFKKIKMSQIDFNKVLYIINLQTQKQFLSSRQKKNFYQSERQKRYYFSHKRIKSRQLASFQNQCVSNKLQKQFLGNLNKEFIRSQKQFKASFPIKRDYHKQKKQIKRKCIQRKDQSQSFITTKRNFQSATSTPINKNNSKRNDLQKCRTSINFYKIEEVMYRNNKLKNLLIRQIYSLEKENDNKSLNTVDKYLKMTTKPVELQQRTKNIQSKSKYKSQHNRETSIFFCQQDRI